MTYTSNPDANAYIAERATQAAQSYRDTLNPSKRMTPYQLAKLDQVTRYEAIRAQADFFAQERLEAEGLGQTDIDHEDYGR